MRTGGRPWGRGSEPARRARPVAVVAALAVVMALLASGCTHPAEDDPAEPPASWWRPTADRALQFQWVLGDRVDLTNATDRGRVDLDGGGQREPDVYDLDGQLTPKSTVDALHARGKIVVCYFDAGVYESYRPDARRFRALKPRIWGRADDQGGPGGGAWDGAYWLDIRRIEELKPIMTARIRQCRDKGFDAVEPDEIDGYANDTGFPLTYQDQLDYNRAIARWTHQAGLSVGQKGDIQQVKDLWPSFDWTLNEECYMYDECDLLDPYVKGNKAVWIAEYPEETVANGGSWPASAVQRVSRQSGDAYVLGPTTEARLCSHARRHRFNLIQFRLGLPAGDEGGRRQCPGWKPRPPLIDPTRVPANP